MTVDQLKDSLTSEMLALANKKFTINISATTAVPAIEDKLITFANLDTGELKCRTLQTCVLFIDIRESTRISVEHQAETVARLYSFFGRAMSLCATHFGGSVRDIIGDRVMVVFPPEDCFHNAINCAILMHSVVNYVIDRHFSADKIRCGIGIDYGEMMVIKTGVIKRGAENAEYKSLVWVGAPANIASKLTDKAGKSTGAFVPSATHSSHAPPSMPAYIGKSPSLADALKQLAGLPAAMPMPAPNLPTATLAAPILVSKAVLDGYLSKYAADRRLFVRKQNQWKKQSVRIPEYKGPVFGSGLVFDSFVPAKTKPSLVGKKPPPFQLL